MTSPTPIYDLTHAIREKKFDDIENLIEACSDLNQAWKPDSGDTPLLAAVRGGHLEIAEKLVASGADVNFGTTESAPLPYAIIFRKPACVAFLLSAGADPNKPAPDAHAPPLELTGINGNAAVAQLLIDAGADIEKDGDFHTPLGNAAEYEQVDVVETLLKAGADVNNTNKNGNTALMQAAQHGNIKIVRMLLKAGASTVEINHDGDDVMYYAKKQGDPAMMSLLETHANSEE